MNFDYYEVNSHIIGIDNFTVIAGPCAVESYSQTLRIATALKKIGINFFRGGCFKPRTDPRSFQGLGKDGLQILEAVKKELNLNIVTEATSIANLNLVNNYADIIQIGARSMYNTELLKECGKLDKPIFLKRSFAATVEEYLLASEYIRYHGNEKIILCERGIRTFENCSRFTMDFAGAAVAQSKSKYPLFFDPSHATGHASLVSRMAKAACIFGGSGLIVEVHDSPCDALCDHSQALSIEEFDSLFSELKTLTKINSQTLN